SEIRVAQKIPGQEERPPCVVAGQLVEDDLTSLRKLMAGKHQRQLPCFRRTANDGAVDQLRCGPRRNSLNRQAQQGHYRAEASWLHGRNRVWRHPVDWRVNSAGPSSCFISIILPPIILPPILLPFIILPPLFCQFSRNSASFC